MDGTHGATKQCNRCHEVKPCDEFEPHQTTKDRRHTFCRLCRKVLAAAYFQMNKVRRQAAAKQRFDPVKHRSYSQSSRQKARLQALTAYGGKCQCCGETTIGFLTIDHLDSDGAEHRRQIGSTLYSWLRANNYPAGFRVLCWNCNCAIGAYGRCPHQDPSAGHIAPLEITKTPSPQYLAAAHAVQEWITEKESAK